jgi:hypothetical protein
MAQLYDGLRISLGHRLQLLGAAAEARGGMVAAGFRCSFAMA